MRYVVTGAAGFIGSHLAKALQEAGHDVIGVDCFTDYYDPAEKEENARGLDVRRLDLAEDALDLDGVDGVFHLAAQAGVRSFGDVFPLYVRRNLLATQRVLEACVQAGVRVVLASSSSVYGEAEAYPTPEDTLSAADLAVRDHEARVRAARARRTGLDAVVLRYFTVYGPRQRPDMFFRRVCEALLAGGGFEIYGTGEQSRSFTYVGDAVAATIAAMERAPAGAVYNVGGGDEASMLEAIALLEQVSGRELDVRHVDAAQGDVSRTKADVTRIHAALGWTPETTLAKGWRQCGPGPRLESPRDEPARTPLRSGSRTGDRLRPLRAADRGALVARRGRAHPRRRDRVRGLARRRPALARRSATLYLGQPYSASGNVQLQAVADEPEHRPPDRARRASSSQLVARACKAKPGDIPRRHLDAERRPATS